MRITENTDSNLSRKEELNLIYVEDMSYIEFKTIIQWCQENFKENNWAIRYLNKYYWSNSFKNKRIKNISSSTGDITFSNTFCFRRKKDLLLFKLTWS